MKKISEPKRGKSILKCIFATGYNPHVSKESARRTLMNTINNDPVLLEKLIRETNDQPRNKTISPRQQEIIVERLGEPGPRQQEIIMERLGEPYPRQQEIIMQRLEEPGLRHENSHVRIAELSRESSRTLT